MPLLDLVSRVVAGPASRVVEAPVRDVIDEVLRQQPMARPEDVDRLRREVSGLTTELQKMQERIAALAAAVDTLQGQQAAPSLDEIVAAVTAALPAPAAVPAADEAAPKKASRKKAATRKSAPNNAVAAKTADEPGRRGRKSLAHLGCGVEGCTANHRSKGFCSKHYQQWRRGNLVGFVSPEGLVASEDGRAFRIDPAHSGAAVAVKGKGKRTSVRVDGSKVDFEAIA